MEPGIWLAVALVVLVALAVAASLWGRLGVARSQVVAALRAALQLAVVSTFIVFAVKHVAAALAFAALMYTIAVWTTTGRTDTRQRWWWSALAVAAGALPVLAIIFGLRVSPFTGASIIPIAGIIIGNMMSAHTLVGRRLFQALREGTDIYEAALALGLRRRVCINLITQPKAAEAILPTIDSTRTVGLVTLPGAFVGVLLGGGSPIQAGAAQLLVLVGIMAGQAVTVTVAHWLIQTARLLPPDLVERLKQ